MNSETLDFALSLSANSSRGKGTPVLVDSGPETTFQRKQKRIYQKDRSVLLRVQWYWLQERQVALRLLEERHTG